MYNCTEIIIISSDDLKLIDYSSMKAQKHTKEKKRKANIVVKIENHFDRIDPHKHSRRLCEPAVAFVVRRFH